MRDRSVSLLLGFGLTCQLLGPAEGFRMAAGACGLLAVLLAILPGVVRFYTVGWELRESTSEFVGQAMFDTMCLTFVVVLVVLAWSRL